MPSVQSRQHTEVPKYFFSGTLKSICMHFFAVDAALTEIWMANLQWKLAKVLLQKLGFASRKSKS
jgi:hypothetical protein